MSRRQTGKVIQTDVHFPETLANHMAFRSAIELTNSGQDKWELYFL